jgi:hypothetical protein
VLQSIPLVAKFKSRENIYQPHKNVNKKTSNPPTKSLLRRNLKEEKTSGQELVKPKNPFCQVKISS